MKSRRRVLAQAQAKEPLEGREVKVQERTQRKEALAQLTISLKVIHTTMKTLQSLTTKNRKEKEVLNILRIKRVLDDKATI